VVAAAMRPAAQGDGVAQMVNVELSAVMSSHSDSVQVHRKIQERGSYWAARASWAAFSGVVTTPIEMMALKAASTLMFSSMVSDFLT